MSAADDTVGKQTARGARQGTRCTAQRKHGLGRCANYAIPGASVCRKHGGAAPQVRRAARERLLALGLHALSVMADLTDHKIDSSVRFQAARDLLNRAHIGEGDALRVESEYAGGMTEEQIEQRLVELGKKAWAASRAELEAGG